MSTAPDPSVPGTPAPGVEPALVVTGLRRAYGDRLALDDVHLSVGRGELFALLGPNGGGKTTLFRTIATLMRPDAGTVRVFGIDATTDPHAVRRRLGVVFQAPALDKRLTVRENLRHHGHLHGLRGAALEQRMDSLLARVGLADRRDDLVLSLSGGLARRAEIAKALLPAPALLLLDEPTTGLDPGVRSELWRDLRALRAESGTTIVLTTHLMDEAAACDRVAILDRGRVVVVGTPAALTSALGGDIIAIESDRIESLKDGVHERFGLHAEIVDGVLRIEQDAAHAWIGRLVEAFPGEIRSITFSRPTLQDVFVHHTGHRFE